MEIINLLIERLERIKAQQKALAAEETACKEALMDAMKEEGLEKEESAYGTVRIQRRADKGYSASIKRMEIELKEAKKLADDMGDYQTLGFKESIVYMPPKELF
jgi:hypothetical protein